MSNQRLVSFSSRKTVKNFYSCPSEEFRFSALGARADFRKTVRANLYDAAHLRSLGRRIARLYPAGRLGFAERGFRAGKRLLPEIVSATQKHRGPEEFPNADDDAHAAFKKEDEGQASQEDLSGKRFQARSSFRLSLGRV